MNRLEELKAEKKRISQEIKSLKKRDKSWLTRQWQGFERVVYTKLASKYGPAPAAATCGILLSPPIDAIPEDKIMASLDRLEEFLDRAIEEGK